MSAPIIAEVTLKLESVGPGVDVTKAATAVLEELRGQVHVVDIDGLRKRFELGDVELRSATAQE